MKICYFGIYERNYSRNRILISGLKKNGVDIVECCSSKRGFLKYLDLIKKYRKTDKDYDLMIVGFPGPQAMVLARILTRKKIIFDAFVSLYDSICSENKRSKFFDFKSLYFFFLDWLACFLADKILLDTNEHIEYFVRTFKIRKEKFVRVFVGSDDSAVRPQDIMTMKDHILVHFHGSFLPLQGVEYIIEAIKILKNEKNIKFRIIGTKIKNKYINEQLSNVKFLDSVPYEDLEKYFGEADIALGIFGGTEKSMRVIPNKVYEALATGKAVLTGESSAAKELLEDKENVLFCRMADPDDLAQKILMLKEDFGLRKKISENGYKLFIKKLTPVVIAGELLKEIK